jgi:ABC-type transport system involved in cytochrome bd biosynthesis fused ATPase/permease subunit
LSSAVLELFSALGVAMVAVYVGFHLLGDISFGAWRRQLSLTEGMFVLLLAPSFFEPARSGQRLARPCIRCSGSMRSAGRRLRAR